MLLKSKITPFSMMSKEWFNAKLAIFSSSEIYNLTKPEGIGSEGMKYIYRKVGEFLSGRAAKDDILTAATAHGNQYEIHGLTEFVYAKNIPVVDGKAPILTQRFIMDGERAGSTPDGIWLITESIDKTAWSDARTIEVKCPYSYDAYIRLKLCKTAADVKRVTPDGTKYYWQVLDQMTVCDCMRGFLVIYQPLFKQGGLNIIEFDKPTIIKETGGMKSNDLKLLNERKQQAISIFNDTIKELTQ